jgi:hypothetical protein
MASTFQYCGRGAKADYEWIHQAGVEKTDGIVVLRSQEQDKALDTLFIDNEMAFWDHSF